MKILFSLEKYFVGLFQGTKANIAFLVFSGVSIASEENLLTVLFFSALCSLLKSMKKRTDSISRLLKTNVSYK